MAKKKITRQTRKQAVRLCAIAASTPSTQGAYYAIAEDCGYSEKAADLAYSAWFAVGAKPGYKPAIEAQAAELIASGFTP